MSLSTRLQRATTAVSLIKSKLSKTGDSDRFWCDHALVKKMKTKQCALVAGDFFAEKFPQITPWSMYQD